MPATNRNPKGPRTELALDLLVPKRDRTAFDWPKLIEDRRVQLKPHLKDLSLPRLGDLPFGGIRVSGSNTPSLSSWLSPRAKASLEVANLRGFFGLGDNDFWSDLDDWDRLSLDCWAQWFGPSDHQNQAASRPVHAADFWALDRSGRWLLVSILGQAERLQVDGKWQSRLRVVSLSAAETSPGLLATTGLDMYRMWNQLYWLVAQMAERKRKSLAIAEKLEGDFRLEYDLARRAVGGGL